MTRLSYAVLGFIDERAVYISANAHVPPLPARATRDGSVTDKGTVLRSMQSIRANVQSHHLFPVRCKMQDVKHKLQRDKRPPETFSVIIVLVVFVPSELVQKPRKHGYVSVMHVSYVTSSIRDRCHNVYFTWYSILKV